MTHPYTICVKAEQTNRALAFKHIILIIIHVYIAPEPSNPVLMCYTILLSLTRVHFNTAPTSTPKGAYNAC